MTSAQSTAPQKMTKVPNAVDNAHDFPAKWLSVAEFVFRPAGVTGAFAADRLKVCHLSIGKTGQIFRTVVKFGQQNGQRLDRVR